MRPTEWVILAQGHFYGGSGRRAETHTYPAWTKITKTRPTKIRLKELERKTKHGGLANSPDALLTCIYGGGRVQYVGHKTLMGSGE